MAAIGRSRRAAPGRTVTVAGFLLGTVSGSGVANTVMLGSVAWPMMRRAGYPPETGGAILAAAGIGAILSPPTLGAAAFLIAEFLQISYLQVIVMAAIPTLLYYLSIFLMVEADSRRLGHRVRSTSAAARARRADAARLAITSRRSSRSPCFMVLGMTAFRAVFWATVLAVALELPAPRNGALAARLVDGAAPRRRRRARRRRHHRHRRHHRRRRHADRARAEGRRADRDAGRRARWR